LGRLAWGCGLDSTGSGQGPVAGCCDCGDEPLGSCTTELVSYMYSVVLWCNILIKDTVYYVVHVDGVSYVSELRPPTAHFSSPR
jgi:hypothetical protein